jgi:hypothetical protein
LAELTGLARGWLDFAAAVWATGREGYLAEAGNATGPAGEALSVLLGEAGEVLRLLQKHGKEARAAIQQLREKVPPPEA